MFIAQEKLNKNVAEYIIYMFQIEDLVRGYQFDIDKITNYIIRPQSKSKALESQAVKWYENIIAEMQSGKLQEKGHIFSVNEVLTELVYLHNTLKDLVKDEKYTNLLTAAENHIESFKKKSNLKTAPIVVICFQAMYMKLLLKLQKKEISTATEEAFDSMRIILAYLTKIYHQMKEGDMSGLEIKNT